MIGQEATGGSLSPQSSDNGETVMAPRKVAVITAGGSGMGADAARRLATDGYDVAILSSSGKGEALARELGGVGVTGSNREVTDLELQKLVDAGSWKRYGPHRRASSIQRRARPQRAGCSRSAMKTGICRHGGLFFKRGAASAGMVTPLHGGRAGRRGYREHIDVRNL